MNRKDYWNKDYVEYWKKRTEEANSIENHASSIVKEDSLASSSENYASAIDLLDINGDDAVLEIGCGFGRSIPYLASKAWNISAIDISKEMIKFAKSSYSKLFPSVNFCVAEAERLPYDGELFNKIICFAVFDALYQKEALVEINRISKIGGNILITGKNDDFFDDDDAALVAEVNARQKGHPNYFTNMKLLLEKIHLFGFKVCISRFFLRRGDENTNKYMDSLPKKFYTYLLILEKISSSVAPIDISSEFSNTWLRKNS
ncbi:MAG: methyltransferase domain-containing protein [Holosporaceae bacterium]|nr:methyltransferase domain-containing protein [Holosporaceae bacterium]